MRGADERAGKVDAANASRSGALAEVSNCEDDAGFLRMPGGAATTGSVWTVEGGGSRVEVEIEAATAGGGVVGRGGGDVAVTGGAAGSSLCSW